MKKIAIITTGLKKVFAGEKGGGGEVLLKNLIFELLKINDVSLFLFTPDEYSVIENIKKNYPYINFITYNQSPYTFSYIDELKETIKNENFDKIINYNMYIPFQTTILQCHSYIHRLNNALPLIKPIKKFFSKEKIKNQKSRFDFETSQTEFIAVSNKIKEDYCKNFDIPEDKIKVIYPGVYQTIKKTLNKKDVLSFGIVANSSINKGGHYLLFALGLLNLTGKKFKLNIIAPKFYKDPLMLFITFIFNLWSKINVFPFQKDMSNFYNKTDVLVLPSVNEAFGLVTLEAMQQGIPVLASSTAGCKEIISADNGFIFNRSSFFDFLKKLNNILNIHKNNFDLFKDISNNSIETSKHYSWKDFTEKVIE